MTANIRVSVVIPAFNAEKTIQKTVESVLSQTYPPCEIIVINDGSEDGTERRVKQFENQVKVITQENAGPSAARNNGVKKAKGDFIAFLDADDEWFPWHLETANDVLREDASLNWYCSRYHKTMPNVKSDTPVFYEQCSRRIFTPESKAIDNFFDAQASLFNKFNLVHTSTVVIAKHLYIAAGGFCETMNHGEDRLLWFRLALLSPKIGYTNISGGVYKRQLTSLTQQSGYDPVTLTLEIAKSRNQLVRNNWIDKSSLKLLLEYMKESVKYIHENGDRELLDEFLNNIQTYCKDVTHFHRICIALLYKVQTSVLPPLRIYRKYRKSLVKRYFQLKGYFVEYSKYDEKYVFYDKIVCQKMKTL